jgi:hypothetical protein
LKDLNPYQRIQNRTARRVATGWLTFGTRSAHVRFAPYVGRRGRLYLRPQAHIRVTRLSVVVAPISLNKSGVEAGARKRGVMVVMARIVRLIRSRATPSTSILSR